MAQILIVDDEASIRDTMKEILEFEKHTVYLAEDGRSALNAASKYPIDLIFCDIKMPGMDGVEVLEHIMERNPEMKMILISGHGNIETAVECLKKGAFDFIEKPIDLGRLLGAVKEAMAAQTKSGTGIRKTIEKEKKTIRANTKETTSQYPMVGDGAAMKHLKAIIARVSPTDARVLITGENGTGKEIVARNIFEQSKRNKAPFVEVNCAAIPSELIESELFGHEKGSFTSAIKQHIGKFEQANGGTLFLDEVGDMSLSAQTKVLRVLQENEITRVGSDKSIKVDVRIIAATNKNLKAEIQNGTFREDLYHRLSVIPICVPPLRERREDIPALIEHFLKTMAGGEEPKKIDAGAVKLLSEKEWSGNIRELRNVIERLVILSAGDITEEDVRMFANDTFF